MHFLVTARKRRQICRRGTAIAKQHYLTVSDIWRSANQLIELYGPDAVFVAARRADELRAADGPEYTRWRRITMAILTWPSAKGNDRLN